MNVTRSTYHIGVRCTIVANRQLNDCQTWWICWSHTTILSCFKPDAHRGKLSLTQLLVELSWVSRCLFGFRSQNVQCHSQEIPVDESSHRKGRTSSRLSGPYIFLFIYISEYLKSSTTILYHVKLKSTACWYHKEDMDNRSVIAWLTDTFDILKPDDASDATDHRRLSINLSHTEYMHVNLAANYGTYQFSKVSADSALLRLQHSIS